MKKGLFKSFVSIVTAVTMFGTALAEADPSRLVDKTEDRAASTVFDEESYTNTFSYSIKEAINRSAYKGKVSPYDIGYVKYYFTTKDDPATEVDEGLVVDDTDTSNPMIVSIGGEDWNSFWFEGKLYVNAWTGKYDGDGNREIASYSLSDWQFDKEYYYEDDLMLEKVDDEYFLTLTMYSPTFLLGEDDFKGMSDPALGIEGDKSSVLDLECWFGDIYELDVTKVELLDWWYYNVFDAVDLEEALIEEADKVLEAAEEAEDNLDEILERVTAGPDNPFPYFIYGINPDPDMIIFDALEEYNAAKEKFDDLCDEAKEAYGEDCFDAFGRFWYVGNISEAYDSATALNEYAADLKELITDNAEEGKDYIIDFARYAAEYFGLDDYVDEIEEIVEFALSPENNAENRDKLDNMIKNLVGDIVMDVKTDIYSEIAAAGYEDVADDLDAVFDGLINGEIYDYINGFFSIRDYYMSELEALDENDPDYETLKEEILSNMREEIKGYAEDVPESVKALLSLSDEVVAIAKEQIQKQATDYVNELLEKAGLDRYIEEADAVIDAFVNNVDYPALITSLLRTYKEFSDNGYALNVQDPDYEEQLRELEIQFRNDVREICEGAFSIPQEAMIVLNNHVREDVRLQLKEAIETVFPVLGLRKYIEDAQNVVDGYLDGEIQDYYRYIDWIEAQRENELEELDPYAEDFEDQVDAINEIYDGMLEGLEKPASVESYEKLSDLAEDYQLRLLEAYKQIINNIEGFSDAVKDAVEEFVQGVINRVNAAYDNVIAQYKAAEEAIQAKVAECKEFVNQVNEAIKDFQAKVAELDPDAEDFEEQLTALKKELAENLEAIYEEYAPAELKAIQDALGNAIDQIDAYIENLIAAVTPYIEALQAQAKAVYDALQAQYDAVVAALDAQAKKVYETIKAQYDAAYAAVQAQYEAIKNKIEAARDSVIAKYNAAQEAIQAKVEQYEEFAKQIAEAIKNYQAQVAELDPYAEDFEDDLRALKRELAENLEAIYEEYAPEELKAIERALGNAADQIDAYIEKLIEAVDAYADELNARAKFVYEVFDARVKRAYAELEAQYDAAVAALKAKYDEIQNKIDAIRDSIVGKYKAAEEAIQAKVAECKEFVNQIALAVEDFQAKVAELDPYAEDFEEQFELLKKELAENLEAIYEEYAPEELKAIERALGNAIDQIDAYIEKMIEAVAPYIEALQEQAKTVYEILDARAKRAYAEIQAQYDAAVAAVKAKYDEIQNKITAIRDCVVAKYQAAQDAIQAKVDECQEFVNQIALAVKDFQAKVAELDPNAEDFEEQLTALKKELAENLETIFEEYAPAELKAIQAAIGDAFDQVDAYIGKLIEAVTPYIEAVEEQAKVVYNILEARAKKAYEALEAQYEAVVAALEAQYAELQMQINAIKDTIEAQYRAVEEAVKAKVAEYAEFVEKVEELIKAFQAQLAELDPNAEDFEEKVAALKAEFIEALQEVYDEYAPEELQALLSALGDAYDECKAIINSISDQMNALEEKAEAFINAAVAQALAYAEAAGPAVSEAAKAAIAAAEQAYAKAAEAFQKGTEAAIDAVANVAGKLKDYVESLFNVEPTFKLNKDVVYITPSNRTVILLSVDPVYAYIDIDWSSDDESIATVDRFGVVKARKVGTTVVRATDKSGNEATCEVVVEFKDVRKKDNLYYYKPVYWAVDRGIANGYASKDGYVKTFGAKDDCTRADMMTFIWRMMGEPETTLTKSPFSDVKKSDYYYNAVLWAYEQGITKGFEDGTFGVDLTVSREDAMTFLYRAAGKPAISSNVSEFSDVQTGKYYNRPIIWAQENGIAKGYAELGIYGVGETCLREQIITFIYRYAKLTGNL